MLPDVADVIVLGGGTAGAAAALACARAGREVLLVESKPLDQAGARWRNGLAQSELEAVGLAVPQPPLAHTGGTFHMVAGWGPSRVTVTDHAIVDLDMPWLVAALHEAARTAGATLHGERRVTALAPSDDHVMVRIGDDSIRAGLVVDAAGMTGPSVSAACPREAICAAAQQDRELADVDDALRFLTHHRAEPGDTLSFTGVAGGYSIVNVAVTLPHGSSPGGVSLLTGSIPGLGHAAGTVLLERFAAEHPFVGPAVSGGSRPIPLVAPDPIVGDGRIVRVGDAARQVFAIHGSGIAPGLRAASLLGEVLARGGGAWDYSVAYHRTIGPTMAAAAAFAAFSARLEPAAVHALIRAGLLHPRLVRDGLHQAPPAVPLSVLPALVAAALGAPRAAGRLLPLLPVLRRLEAVQRDYPDDPSGVPAWAERREALLARARGA